MVQLSDAQIDEIAELARLSILPADRGKIAGELNAVLENFKTLDALDLDGVPPQVTGGFGENAREAGESDAKISPDPGMGGTDVVEKDGAKLWRAEKIFE